MWQPHVLVLNTDESIWGVQLHILWYLGNLQLRRLSLMIIQYIIILLNYTCETVALDALISAYIMQGKH